MNKIIDSKKNILKICAGNDFSIVVQITEYDTETGAWVNYDLSAVSDVHMTLVAENGKHIKLPVVVREDGTVSAPVQAAYLQKSTYGIELTWVTNDLNRRTYSPCLMQIVTTTAESSSNIAEYESNDAYHFNIKMYADVAVLSIGKISDEYITESELQDELENYVTNSYLSTTLEDYATISSLDDYATKQYVDDEIASIDLSSYVKLEDLGSYAKLEDLSSYVTYSYLDSKVDPIDARITALENEPQVPSNVVTSYNGTYIYCLTQSEYDSLQQLDPDTFYYITDASTNYATLSDLSSYAKLADLSSYATLADLSSYATTQYVDNEISSIDLSSYATLSDLSSYATTQYVDNEIASIDLSSYATIQYVDDSVQVANDYTDAAIGSLPPIPTFTSDLNNDSGFIPAGADISLLNNDAGYITSADLSSYATTQYVDNEIASIDLSSYAKFEDLSSYVTYTDWDNSNEAIAQELTNNRLEHLSINDNFNNYYTKTETDNRYATSSWANSNFVKQTDDTNRQQAIAAAFASSVQSTYIHNIWSGSQSDYNQLTPDSYTLYIIL